MAGMLDTDTVVAQVSQDGDEPELEAEPAKDLYFAKSLGVALQLRKVDPIKLQNAATAVKIPKPPSYKTTTITGKVREFVMDEQAAKETPGGKDLWDRYQVELRSAQGEQFNFLARTCIFYGVSYTPPDDGWEEELVFLGYELPSTQEMRKVLYLLNQLKIEEINDLIIRVMELATTSQEVVREAEASFPSALRKAQRPA